MQRLLLIAALALAWSSPSFASPASQRVCDEPEGWSEVSRLDARFIVFGESHGTREAPAFVGQLLCALAQRGERVLLATELTSSHDPKLQKAWAAPIERFPEALLKGGWEKRDDGVGSEAMFDLVAHARRLREDGFKVGVTAFNGAKDDEQRERFAKLPAQGPHEAAQAQNIFEAAEAGGYTRVIVLVGSFHARKAKTSLGGVEMEPMAVKLARMGPTVSLVMEHAPGSTWACQARDDFEFVPGKPIPADAISCQEHPAGGKRGVTREAHMGLGALGGGKAREGFDGYFWVGPVSASPPAIREDAPQS